MGGGSTQSSGIQGSSQHHTSGLLQLTSDISKEADVRSSSEQGSKYSGIKMHEASEAQTLSVKTFEEVKPVQQDKEHSDVLFSSSVQTKRHIYFGQSFNAVSKSTHVGSAEQVQIRSQVDVNAVHDVAVARNVGGGALSEKLKK